LGIDGLYSVVYSLGNIAMGPLMIDPKEMLSTIVSAGYSQARIAIEIDVSQPTVNRIINGSQSPSYATGKKIEALYALIKSGARPGEPDLSSGPTAAA
jgi:transcriptional regulator with XRE-family HTH domain